ncbi:1 [Durusdinium trenchii]|uniref:Reductase subunit) (1 n=1 Tax=Durusdinium trenchii TaxID=1381693 RepID=A0ABP0LJW2_9DINO
MEAIDNKPSADRIWNWLKAVPDPEIPVVSVVDLGIVRDFAWEEGVLAVRVTPTYSGCPATAVISMSIEEALRINGIDEIRIETVLSPPWTTDWISDEGKEKLKAYGIAPPVDGINDEVLRVGIKRVDGGWFSSWANEELKVGDTLEAMKPMGNFYADLDPTAARRYLGFAGGSGITPLISIIKTVLEEEPKSTFSLVYGNRSAASVMFREELEDLKNIYLGRLSVLHILETESDIDLFSGRVDREKCDALFDAWLPVGPDDYAFICGPEPMMLAVSDALKSRGVAKDKIKFELFKSSHPKKAKAKTSQEADATATCEATVTVDGISRTFGMTKDQTILEAALAANLGAPFACKAGVCSTCRAKVIEGEGEMEANFALEDYEVEHGFVLTCQCRPLSDKIVIDYDQH